MKKIKSMMWVMAGCLAFISCSDDSDDNNSSLSESLAGSYRLTSAILPNVQDLDNDGDSSTNAVFEGPCYNDSWISFHEDGTFDESLRVSAVSGGGTTLTCDTQTTSGTYTVSGNTVTTIDGSGDTTVYSFDSDSRAVSVTETNVAYPSWNSVLDVWTSLTANIKYTFTKYTDNDDDNGATADNDGINNDENNANFWLIGNFDLTAFTVANAQNLDNDGDSSTNLVTESTCYGQSNITFNQNGTYQEERTIPVISGSNLTLSCDTETTIGTWTRTGNTITTTRIGSGSGSATTTYTFNATTHVLTRTNATGNFPGFNTTTSLYALLTGTVNYTYTRD